MMIDERTKKIQSVTLWGAVVNLVLSVLKLIAGLVAASSAMVADAIHSLSDLVSDVIVVVFARISSKGQDNDHDYGHGKFETLATAIVCLLLVVVGIEMMLGAIDKIHFVIDGGHLEKPGILALVAAVVSIAAKEVLYQWTYAVGRKIDSPVMVTNAWHHRTDAMSSAGALVGIAGAIFLGGEWTILDPITCVIISILILFVAIKMAIPVVGELTDKSLPDDMEQEIIGIAQSVKGVNNVHDLKTRYSGSVVIAEMHIVVDPEMTVNKAHDITLEIERKLRETFGHEMQLNLHVEPSEDAL